MIVAHHPVIFTPLKRMDRRDVPFLLAEASISAICMHTNFDAAEGGVNDTLAGILGMQEVEPFAGGCGRVGTLDTQAPLTVPPLPALAQSRLGPPRLPPRDGPAGGAGGRWPGEGGHPAAVDAARRGLGLIAAGHYATEYPAVAALAARLQEAVPGLAVFASRENRDPFTYL